MKAWLALLCALPLAAAAQTFRSSEHSFRVVKVVEALEQPWSVAFLPDGRMLITEKAGRLRVVAKGALDPNPIAGLPEVTVHGQGGLQDVVLHPEFSKNSLVYVSYAARGSDGVGTELARGRLAGHRLEDVQVLFRQSPKGRTGNHFGGRIVFDRAGYVYLTLGNRNQQGAALHPATGVLWTHEHGPQGGDEVNVIRAGANYGWPVITYGANYGSGTKIGEGTHKQGMQQPIHYWVPSIAPSGMAFYTGDKFAQWKGDLFVGALRDQMLVHLKLDGEKVVSEERLLKGVLGRIRDVRVGPDGFIYLLTDERFGVLARLEPAQ